MLNQRPDYAVPLLRLLASLPGGAGTRKEVERRFLERFESEVPKAHLEVVPSGGQERWAKHLGWTNWNLRNMGLTNAPEHGVWRITQAGRDWLAANPGTARMRPGTGRSVRSGPPERSAPTVVPQGITFEMLEHTRQVMPLDQFRQIWGEIYDQFLAEERRKAITPVNDRFLAEKARFIVQRVQDFLQGRSSEAPKSEMVCDWIFTCYNLELFREGVALWRYVNKDEVNDWQYERTSKYSAACRARAGL